MTPEQRDQLAVTIGQLARVCRSLIELLADMVAADDPEIAALQADTPEQRRQRIRLVKS